MSIVVSLPNLEELELINNAFIGSDWGPNDGDQFLKLKSLLIDRMDLQHWKATEAHFPQLQRLIIWECGKLKEFPGPNHIFTLKMIELDDASPSAVAKAKEMLQEQHEDWGNEDFQVCFYYMWNHMYQKRKEEQEAYARRKEEEERERKDREDEERERKRREGPRYYGGYPDSFGRSHSSMHSSSWDWPPQNDHFGRFDGRIGHEVGPSRFDPGGFGSFR